MGIYVGVNGTPKEVTAVYVGVNGVPKECSDIYVGVNGTPKPCYSGVKPGETVFTSSTNFTVPKGVKKIDVFCVGGGGGTSYMYTTVIAFNAITGTFYISGGGGGGYTTTKLGVPVTPGQQLSVMVGGGGGGAYRYSDGTISSPKDGGISSVGDLCSAAGGKITNSDGIGGTGGGGNGGSGGAGGVCAVVDSPSSNTPQPILYGGLGGKDGENGGKGSALSFINFAAYYYDGGKGQGTTTRYFGESSGTLYSTGGCGYNVAKGGWTASSPGDGGSGILSFIETTGYVGGSGSSGICIIRWGKR